MEVHVERDVALLARLQRPVEVVDAIAERLVVQGEFAPPMSIAASALSSIDLHMDVGNRSGIRVVHAIDAVHAHRLRFRMQVDIGADRQHFRLRQVLVLAEITLVARLQVELRIGRDVVVADVGIPEQSPVSQHGAQVHMKFGLLGMANLRTTKRSRAS